MPVRRMPEESCWQSERLQIRDSYPRPGEALTRTCVIHAPAIRFEKVRLLRAFGKDRAHETTCVNNLRQIGIATKLYQDDHESKFPPAFVSYVDPVSGASRVRPSTWGR